MSRRLDYCSHDAMGVEPPGGQWYLLSQRIFMYSKQDKRDGFETFW